MLSIEELKRNKIMSQQLPQKYLQDAIDPLVFYFKENIDFMYEYWDTFCGSKTETQVDYLLVDLRPLVNQRKILKMIDAEEIFYEDKLVDGKDYRLFFNRKEFAKTLKGMMSQADWAKADEEEMGMIMNMIKAHYQDTSKT